jgi:hypothetical protein
MQARHMRFIAVLSLIGVFLLVVAYASFADQGDPVLVLPEKSFDFGYVSQNVSISHPFVIRNGGGDSLYILDLKPG